MCNRLIGERYFNDSETRFALIPGRTDDPEGLQKDIETLLRKHAETEALDEKNDVISALIEMHTQGLVLWPLGALWGRSALGEVNEQRFARTVQECDPEIIAVRASIEGSEYFNKAVLRDSEKRNRSFIFWKLFMAIHLAGENIAELDDVLEAHIVALTQAFKENGRWKQWVKTWTKKNIRFLATFLNVTREQPLFGVSILQDLRESKVAPRTPDIVSARPDLEFVVEQYELWIDLQNVLTKDNYRDGLRLLLAYLAQQPPAAEDEDLKLLSRTNLSGLLEFARGWRPAAVSQAVTKIHRFTQYLADEIERGGTARPDIGVLDSEVQYFLNHLPSSQSQSRSAHGDVAARPMPARFHHRLKEIITEDDFAWPKSLVHAKTGKPLHWITWFNPKTGLTEPVFCEVMPRMLLLHLDLPLRNIQVRRLDSGEGDSRVWDAETGKWKTGTGKHAGYWERIGAKNPRRGVFREIQTLSGQITGFWINSNKTQSSGQLFGETSGYEIPWQHDEVLQNLAAMRAWQEKYNPVEAPLEHRDVVEGIFDDEPSGLVKHMLPARFYLFRYPLNVGPRGNEAPVGYDPFAQFFLDALDELERRLREEDPDFPINIITRRDSAGSPRKAIFSIHGMRSSTLTTLYMAGVPIEILSKVVAGHATILMTLKYTKFDPVHVNEILTRARAQALAAARDEFPDLLKNASLERAMQMTARLADDGLHQMKGSYDEPTVWARFDIGICPNAGTQCHVGGQAVIRHSDKGKNKSSYGPVPGGHRNCVRCRFFVTGLPFLIPLWAHANAIFARVDKLAKKIDEARGEIEALKAERHRISKAGEDVPHSLGARIRLLDETWVADDERMKQALADAHATLLLVEKVRTLASENSEPISGPGNLPMLLPEDGVPEVVGRPSTRFALVDAVVQASRWFPSVADPDNEAERDEFINQILCRNGYMPITAAPLTKAERRKAADALAELLLSELQGAETQNLIDGKKTLAEFGGLQKRMEDVARRTIGRALDRLAPPRPSRGMLIDAVAEE